MALLRYSAQSLELKNSCIHEVKLGNISSTEVAKRWAEANTKDDCYYGGWHNHVFFRFKNTTDALMFKLMFG